ncbi:MAG: M23 family metallopeptidase [Pseudomonadota bacterium]
MSSHSVPRLTFPLPGVWQFLRPPGHHPNAFDFVQVGKDGRMHEASRMRGLGSGVPSSAFHCWGQTVLSPIDGTVLRCAGDWPDHETNSLWTTIGRWCEATYRFRPREIDGELDIRPNAGNFVMIEAPAGFIVFVAHLMAGSVRVRAGQAVSVGDPLGRVGNSGNSTAPHLHMNLFDQMSEPYAAKVLPFVFDTFEARSSDGAWRTQRDSLPALKALVRSTSPLSHRGWADAERPRVA